MKKTLLTLALAGLTGLAAMADQYTFVFDGENSLGGLPRQTTNNVNQLQFVDQVEISENGINVAVTKTAGTGKGYALVNAGGTNAGIYVSSSITPQVSITVPNGKITGATIYLTGASMITLEVNFNGSPIAEPNNNNGALYGWKWNTSEGSETLIINWASGFLSRYIHSIELTYTQDLGDKQECGLAFDAEAAEGFVGEDFIAPILSNPNNLPLTWTSSDPAIASVDGDGNVTLFKGGKTYITATTGGNDEFAPGSARYELTSIPVSNSLIGMLQVAPAAGDKVKVNCPLTVNYGSGIYAYVTDEMGTAGYIQNAAKANEENTGTLYKAGDIIPAGWVATYTKVTAASSTFFWAGNLEEVTETTEVVYPEVTSISYNDNNRVLTLLNVTFTTPTCSGTTIAYGTTPDGDRIEFQATFNPEEMPAGTYDVTGVVLYSKANNRDYFWMAPFAYKDNNANGLDNITINNENARYFNLQGQEIANPGNGVFIKVTNGKATKVILK